MHGIIVDYDFIQLNLFEVILYVYVKVSIIVNRL